MKIEKELFEVLIKEILPSFYYNVTIRKNYFDNDYLQIIIASNGIAVNGIKPQYPQCISFCYDSELTVQQYGGCGGQSIILKSEDQHLYCKRLKVNFRKSKGLAQSLNNLKNFLKKYKELLVLHKDELLYSDIVDYNLLLKE
jgi:hypothetical protein